MGWQAAISLDLELLCLGAAGEAAVGAGAPLLEGNGRDPAALAALADRSDVMTFEHELVDLPALAELETEGAQVRPSAAVLALAVDKLHQRRTLAAFDGVHVPSYASVTGLPEIESFAAQHSWPVVHKARSGGYDGRGVWMCADGATASRALQDGQAAGLELYVEEAVDITVELAVLVARSPSGEVAVHPPVETCQVDGMCRSVVMPPRVPEKIAGEVEDLARNLADRIGLEGLMAVELFLTRDDRLLINELAMRTHNTGHLHTEASTTSQFEQHLRAPPAPWAPPPPPPHGSDPASRLQDALRVPGASVHLYGKSARPGRKLGHVTVCATTPEDALRLAHEAADRLEGNG
jgi:5-(carboxyamino)imidazole ribonucleotide synthase